MFKQRCFCIHKNCKVYKIHIISQSNYRILYFLDSIDFSKRINEKCNILHELPVSTCELHVETSNVDKSIVELSPSSLKVKIGN